MSLRRPDIVASGSALPLWQNCSATATKSPNDTPNLGQALVPDGADTPTTLKPTVDGHVIPPGLLSRNSATGGPRLQATGVAGGAV